MNMEKKMNAMTTDTLTSMIKAVNEMKIQKEDIVSMFKSKENYILVYYY